MSDRDTEQVEIDRETAQVAHEALSYLLVSDWHGMSKKKVKSAADDLKDAFSYDPENQR